MKSKETQKQREVRLKKGPKYNPTMVRNIKRAQAGQFETVPPGVDLVDWLESSAHPTTGQQEKS